MGPSNRGRGPALLEEKPSSSDAKHPAPGARCTVSQQGSWKEGTLLRFDPATKHAQGPPSRTGSGAPGFAYCPGDNELRIAEIEDQIRQLEAERAALMAQAGAEAAAAAAGDAGDASAVAEFRVAGARLLQLLPRPPQQQQQQQQQLDGKQEGQQQQGALGEGPEGSSSAAAARQVGGGSGGGGGDAADQTAVRKHGKRQQAPQQQRPRRVAAAEEPAGSMAAEGQPDDQGGAAAGAGAAKAAAVVPEVQAAVAAAVAAAAATAKAEAEAAAAAAGMEGQQPLVGVPPISAGEQVEPQQEEGEAAVLERSTDLWFPAHQGRVPRVSVPKSMQGTPLRLIVNGKEVPGFASRGFLPTNGTPPELPAASLRFIASLAKGPPVTLVGVVPSRGELRVSTKDQPQSPAQPQSAGKPAAGRRQKGDASAAAPAAEGKAAAGTTGCSLRQARQQQQPARLLNGDKGGGDDDGSASGSEDEAQARRQQSETVQRVAASRGGRGRGRASATPQVGMRGAQQRGGSKAGDISSDGGGGGGAVENGGGDSSEDDVPLGQRAAQLKDSVQQQQQQPKRATRQQKVKEKKKQPAASKPAPSSSGADSGGASDTEEWDDGPADGPTDGAVANGGAESDGGEFKAAGIQVSAECLYDAEGRRGAAAAAAAAEGAAAEGAADAGAADAAAAAGAKAPAAQAGAKAPSGVRKRGCAEAPAQAPAAQAAKRGRVRRVPPVGGREEQGEEQQQEQEGAVQQQALEVKGEGEGQKEDEKQAPQQRKGRTKASIAAKRSSKSPAADGGGAANAAAPPPAAPAPPPAAAAATSQPAVPMSARSLDQLAARPEAPCPAGVPKLSGQGWASTDQNCATDVTERPVDLSAWHHGARLPGFARANDSGVKHFLRVHLFSMEGKQLGEEGSKAVASVKLSKACHDCQGQHVAWKCSSCPGTLSWCQMCLESRYPTIPVAELMSCCPRCRGICSCRACLRVCSYKPPSYEEQELGVMAQWVLAHGGPQLWKILQGMDEEAAIDGIPLEEVPTIRLDVDERPQCDRCATNILDLHRNCSACGWDYCLDCCRELRTAAAAAAANGVAATNSVTAATADCAVAAANGVAASGGQNDAGDGVDSGKAAAAAPPLTCANPACDGLSRAARVAAARRLAGLAPAAVPAAAEGTTAGRAVLAGLNKAWGQQEQPLVQQQQQEQEEREQQEEQEGLEGEQAPEAPRPRRERKLTARAAAAAASASDGTDSDAAPVFKADAWLDGEEGPRGAALGALQGAPVLTLLRMRPVEELRGWREVAKEHGAGGQVPAPVTLSADFSWALSPDWWRKAPDEWRRKASGRGVQDYLFSPHADDLKPSSPHFAMASALFWARWELREPVLVRGCKGSDLQWDPDTMTRATRDISHKKPLSVMDCADWTEVEMTELAFFNGYKQQPQDVEDAANGGIGNGTDSTDGTSTAAAATAAAPAAAAAAAAAAKKRLQLKLKDWPPEASFQERLGRHFQDFCDMLPIPQLTLPQLATAPLNLATALLPRDNPTDLGPKTYVAYGTEEERSDPANNEGDSVTKLHLDMTDAVNVLVHAQYAAGRGPGPARHGDTEAVAPSWGGAGAVWDIFRCEDAAPLCGWLREHAGEFVHEGRPVAGRLGATAMAPVLSQRFMLVDRHRKALAADTGVSAWTFEQFPHEAVFIPAGCAHQVRNLRPCTKVAVDFITPASLQQASIMRSWLREADLAEGRPCQHCVLPNGDNAGAPYNRAFQEKLQSQLVVLRGCMRAWDTLQGRPWPKPVEQPKGGGSSGGGGSGGEGRKLGRPPGGGKKRAGSQGGSGAREEGGAARRRGRGGGGRPRGAGRKSAASSAGDEDSSDSEEREEGEEEEEEQTCGKQKASRGRPRLQQRARSRSAAGRGDASGSEGSGVKEEEEEEKQEDSGGGGAASRAKRQRR